MKTNKWIYAIAMASLCWMGCDDDDDNPVNKPSLNDTDESFVENAAISNKAQIEFGQIATTKATDSLVKAFAQELIDEHTAAQNELKDIADDFGSIDWPNELDDSQDAIIEKLNSASGFSFDTLYIKTQITLHQNAKSTFQTAAGNTTEVRVKGYASKYLPRIEAHLQQADSLETVIITNDIMDETPD